MLKFKRNIIRIILSVTVLVSGNFTFALMHGDCFSDETGHHKCEMECCVEDDCCTEEQKAVEYKNENSGCCETHIEQAVEQDAAVLLVNKVSESKFQAVQSFTPLGQNEYSYQDHNLLIHKFKTSNIFLEVSNLRI